MTRNMIRDKLLAEAHTYSKDRWVLEELNLEDVWDIPDEEELIY